MLQKCSSIIYMYRVIHTGRCARRSVCCPLRKILPAHIFSHFLLHCSKTNPGCYVGIAIFSPDPPTYQFQGRIIFTDYLSILQALSNPIDIINSSHITIFRIKSILLELEAEDQSVVLACKRRQLVLAFCSNILFLTLISTTKSQ